MSTTSSESRQSAILSQSDKTFDVFNLKEGDKVNIKGDIEFYEKNKKYPDVNPGRYNGDAEGEFQSLFSHPLGQPPNKIRIKLKLLTIKNPKNTKENITLTYTKDSSLATAYITKDEDGRVNNISASTSNEGADSESNYRDSLRSDSVSTDATSSNSSISGITQSSEAAASSNKNEGNNPRQMHPMNRGPFDFLWGKGGRGKKTRKNRRRIHKSSKSRRARPGKKCLESLRKNGRARKSLK